MRGMTPVAKVEIATQALREALEELYQARDCRWTFLSKRELGRLSRDIEACASHEALASPGMF